MARKIIMYKIQILPFVLCKRIGKHKDMRGENCWLIVNFDIGV